MTFTEIQVTGDEPMESANMENNITMSSSYAGVLKGKSEDTAGKHLDLNKKFQYLNVKIFSRIG